MPLNPKEAPPGFRAEPTIGGDRWWCLGCYFLSHPGCFEAGPCTPNTRRDGHQVIFVKARKKGKNAKPKKKARARKAST